MIAHWVEDPYSKAYKCHLDRIPDYFWVSEDGAKFQVFKLPLALRTSTLLHKYMRRLYFNHVKRYIIISST